MTNIETPEGWTPSGPCFTRVYGGKFAVIDVDQDEGGGKCWVFSSYSPRESEWLPLSEAVSWANAELGVPTPVEVVEEKFEDGSRVLKDSEGKRVAFVQFIDIGRWIVHYGKWLSEFTSDDAACEKARAYVRGGA